MSNPGERIDPIPEIKEALDVLRRNINSRRDLDPKAVSDLLSRVPMLVEEAEAGRKKVEEMGYAVVIHDPDNDAIVESQGPVKVFYVDLGGGFDIGNPDEGAAKEAMEQAAEYARDADKLPDGVVKDTLYGAAEQIMDEYGKFKDAAEALSAEDKAALSDWLPEAAEKAAEIA